MADQLYSGLGVRLAVLTTDILALLPVAGPPAQQADVAKLIVLLNTIYAPITGGAYVLKAGDTMTGLLTIAQATANTSNLILNGQSLTGANAQSLLSMAGTWNTSGVPAALLLNITNTASGAGSLLADFQIGGVSRASISKLGTIKSTIPTAADSCFVANGLINSNMLEFQIAGAFKWIEYLDASFNLNFFDTGTVRFGLLQGQDAIFIGGAMDCVLRREGLDSLSLRRGTNPQNFFWYYSFTDAANYERGVLSNVAGQILIAAETAGTGTDNIDVVLIPAGTGNVTLPGGVLLKTSAALTNGAAAALGTLANAPAAGNPTKWVPVNDNGTTRYVPMW